MDFDKISTCLLFPFSAEQPDLRVRKRPRHTYYLTFSHSYWQIPSLFTPICAFLKPKTFASFTLFIEWPLYYKHQAHLFPEETDSNSMVIFNDNITYVPEK